MIVIHHIGGTIVLLWSLLTDKTYGLLWICSLLATEIPGDLIYLCSAHGYNDTGWYRKLVWFNIVQYIAIRIMGSLVIIIHSYYLYPLSTIEFLWAIIAGLGYGSYLLTYVWKQIKKYRSMTPMQIGNSIAMIQ
jgi:hypothetical protein